MQVTLETICVEEFHKNKELEKKNDALKFQVSEQQRVIEELEEKVEKLRRENTGLHTTVEHLQEKAEKLYGCYYSGVGAGRKPRKDRR